MSSMPNLGSCVAESLQPVAVVHVRASTNTSPTYGYGAVCAATRATASSANIEFFRPTAADPALPYLRSGKHLGVSYAVVTQLFAEANAAFVSSRTHLVRHFMRPLEWCRALAPVFQSHAKLTLVSLPLLSCACVWLVSYARVTSAATCCLRWRRSGQLALCSVHVGVLEPPLLDCCLAGAHWKEPQRVE